MMLYKHKYKKIKGAAHKNGDVDGTCNGMLTLAETETWAETDVYTNGIGFNDNTLKWLQ